MSNYPDNFNNAAFEARWGDAPEYDTPDPKELREWCTKQAIELAAIAKANFIKAFGEDFDFDVMNVVPDIEDTLRETIDDFHAAAYIARNP